jgi:hypothetical protein
MQPTEASRPDPRVLSISHLTVLDAAPPELVTAAADAGFDADPPGPCGPHRVAGQGEPG